MSIFCFDPRIFSTRTSPLIFPQVLILILCLFSPNLNVWLQTTCQVFLRSLPTTWCTLVQRCDLLTFSPWDATEILPAHMSSACQSHHTWLIKPPLKIVAFSGLSVNIHRNKSTLTRFTLVHLSPGVSAFSSSNTGLLLSHLGNYMLSTKEMLPTFYWSCTLKWSRWIDLESETCEIVCVSFVLTSICTCWNSVQPRILGYLYTLPF